MSSRSAPLLLSLSTDFVAMTALVQGQVDERDDCRFRGLLGDRKVVQILVCGFGAQAVGHAWTGAEGGEAEGGGEEGGDLQRGEEDAVECFSVGLGLE